MPFTLLPDTKNLYILISYFSDQRIPFHKFTEEFYIPSLTHHVMTKDKKKKISKGYSLRSIQSFFPHPSEISS